MRVPYTLPLLPELARVNVMIVGGHLDNLHVSAACRMPALAFRLALATMSLPAVVVVRMMVRKTWKAERGASAASGYPAHDTRTLPTRWRGSAGPRARVATLTSNVRQGARCRLSLRRSVLGNATGSHRRTLNSALSNVTRVHC